MEASDTKNTDGRNGAICNYCGGFGFTNNVLGGASGCPKCGGDGIEPVDVRKLAEQVASQDAKLDLILSKLG